MNIPESSVINSAVALAESMMTRHPSGSLRWHYETGLFLSSLWSLSDFLRDDHYKDYIKAHADALVDASGAILGYKDDEYNLDQINSGKILLELSCIYDDRRYAVACETLGEQLAAHPRTDSGSYWHKKIYPYQVWLDGLYMFGPFAARYALLHKDSAMLDDVCDQLLHAEEKTRDPKTGLLMHAWDESRKQLWADSESGRSPHAWGRAMGWYAMALCDVLELLPDGHPKRHKLEELCRRLMFTIASFRDSESGMWLQVLDQAGRPGNYPETSASAMFIYALQKSRRLGLSEAGTDDVLPAFTSLSARYLSKTDKGVSLGGICKVAGLGGTPYRDGTYTYYINEPVGADDFKGVGPYIMAAVELGRAEYKR